MTSKREKLQYAYVFLTDFVTTGISVVLAWLITDNVFNKLQDYATFDWIQALCLLLLAFVLTFLCFDQDQNIVTRSKGDEIILALKFNVVLGVVNAACLVLAKATLLDSRYFAVMVPIVNVVLMPITHGLLKKFLLKLQHSRGSESLVGFVTTGDRAEKLIAEIQGDWSRRIIGAALLEATPETVGTRVAGVEVKATFDDFMAWLRREALDEVYVDVPMDSGESFIPYLE